MSAGNIYTMDVSFGTIRGKFDTQPTYYDVWVENTTGQAMTWLQRYMLADFEAGTNDYFIFVNSLGGFDTIRFSGDRKEINKLESVNAIFDDQTLEYDIDRTRSWKKYTGYIADEQLRMWVLDFFNSPQRYHLTDSGALQRIYVSEPKLEDTAGETAGYEFTYAYSRQSRYINLERAETPQLLEITDPASEVFFLAPRLNQFEAADPASSADYLIPIQAAAADKWLAISLASLLDYIKPTGIDVDALQDYLTDHKYATQAWVSQQNFLTTAALDNYLLKSVWDEVFEITTENGVRVLNVKLDIVGLKGISAYGLGSTSGGSASGSLGELVNVGQWADEVPTADRVMVQLAGTTHWSAKPLADLVGLDTAALAQYLTANSYLKASDISSYLTWANLSGKPTVYPTNWANIADKPTVYPTTWTSVTGRPTKLSQFTDDVVAGNYLPKPTWDAVFEVVTVDGTPALKVKYDILGLKGITAYADGTLSGGFSGALVDLVDVVVTNLASGDILKYNGTHFVNVPVSSIAGASSWDQITGKPEYYPTRWADVSGAPTSLPASDVYPWAKAATKPTYTAAEVGALALSGGVLAGDVYLGGGLAIRDNTASHSNVIGLLNTGDGTFFTAVGSGSRRMVLYSSVDLYRDNGSTQYRIYDSSNFNPSSKLDKSVWDEAFELKTVNGVRVISAKLDFLSVAGISAYATGPSSGGGGGGLDYDLLKQALTGAITPDGYPFTISASFLGAIDKTYLTGKLANTYANKVHTHLWTDITDRPTSLPANGGNADTVDNLHGSSFAQIKSYTYPDGGINNITDLDFTGNIQAHFPGHEYSCIWQGKDFRGVIFQLKLKDYYTQSMMYRGGETKTWMTVWDSGNFNPANKFGFSADQLSDLNNAPNNAFFVGAYNATNSPVQNSWSNGFTIAYGNNTDFRKQFCYAGEKWWTRGRDGVNWGTWRQIWDSGNFNPDNYLNAKKGLISDLNTATGSGVYYFSTPGSVNTPENYGSLLVVATVDNGSPWINQFAFGTSNKIWHRQNINNAGWNSWTYLYDSGNFNPDNYLPLSGNKMITGDFQFEDGVSVRDAAGRSVVGLLDVAGDGVCVVVGNSAKKTRIVTPNDTPVYRNDGKGAYRIYDSSNSNISTVDWAAKNITAAGTVTATKLVLGGITIDVYNGALRVNGNLVATGGVTSLATA